MRHAAALLAERVETLGGRYEAGPGSTGGFRLYVYVPMEQSVPGKYAPHTQPPTALRTAAVTAVERREG